MQNVILSFAMVLTCITVTSGQSNLIESLAFKIGVDKPGNSIDATIMAESHGFSNGLSILGYTSFPIIRWKQIIKKVEKSFTNFDIDFGPDQLMFYRIGFGLKYPIFEIVDSRFYGVRQSRTNSKLEFVGTGDFTYENSKVSNSWILHPSADSIQVSYTSADFRTFKYRIMAGTSYKFNLFKQKWFLTGSILGGIEMKYVSVPRMKNLQLLNRTINKEFTESFAPVERKIGWHNRPTFTLKFGVSYFIG